MGSRTGEDKDKKNGGQVANPSAASNEPNQRSINEVLGEISDISNSPSDREKPADKLPMKIKIDTILKDLLIQRKLSARKASTACGIPMSTFSGYLKPNRSQLDPEHLLSLSRFFKVSVDYLLTGKDSTNKLMGLPAKTIFSRVVKLTIEEIDGIEG